MFATLSNDPWIRAQSSINPAKIHALGMITLGWNACETHLFLLFGAVAKLPAEIAWALSHDLGDIAIAERIRQVAKLNALPEYQMIDDFLRVYDLCRMNRNSFTHFKFAREPDGTIALARMKGPTTHLHPLPNKLTDFRRVAEEIWNLSRTLRLLWVAVAARQDGEMRPLPKTPPLPDLLWKPAQQTPTKPPRPPRSSRASRRRVALVRRSPP